MKVYYFWGGGTGTQPLIVMPLYLERLLPTCCEQSFCQKRIQFSRVNSTKANVKHKPEIF